MKRFFFHILAAVSIFGMTSCSKDDTEPAIDSRPVKVSLSVGVDSRNDTRAFGDASSANILKYAVYAFHDGEYTYIYNEQTKFDSSQNAVLDVSLALGENYRVVFFAHCDETSGNETADMTAFPYALDFENATLTVDYEAIALRMTVGLKDFDCFYNYVDIDADNPVVNHAVILRRPMAQINWGTAHVDDTTITKTFPQGIRTRFKATLYNKMNLLTGTVEANSTFALNPTVGMSPIEEAKFPIDGYDWLYSCYVLVPGAQDASALLDAALEIWNGNENCIRTVDVTNVPYGRNCRTNIYGKLIPSSGGGNVGIDPGFGGDFNIEIP